jgi:hypothetical protein
MKEDHDAADMLYEGRHGAPPVFDFSYPAEGFPFGFNPVRSQLFFLTHECSPEGLVTFFSKTSGTDHVFRCLAQLITQLHHDLGPSP